MREVRREHDLRRTLIALAASHYDLLRTTGGFGRVRTIDRWSPRGPAEQFSQRDTFSRRNALRERNKRATCAPGAEHVAMRTRRTLSIEVRTKTSTCLGLRHQPVNSFDTAVPLTTSSDCSRVSSLNPTSGRSSCRAKSVPSTLTRGFGRAAKSYCHTPMEGAPELSVLGLVY